MHSESSKIPENLGLSKEVNKELFRLIKPYFIEKLGQWTHQRVAPTWHFHGLAFVRDELTYLFGYNIGYFKQAESEGYSHVGMNVLVRTNGKNPELRLQYRDFFKENLKNWINKPESVYTSDRGGLGSEFARYRAISEFESFDHIQAFLRESIDKLHDVYYEIYKNPDNLFEHVLKGAYPWELTILELAAKKTNQTYGEDRNLYYNKPVI